MNLNISQRIILLIAIVIILSACSITGNNKDEEDPPPIEEPVVQGMFIIDGYQENLGRWRDPEYPHPVLGEKTDDGRPTYLLKINAVYPNPVTEVFVIKFDIGIDGFTEAWLTPARLPEEAKSNYVKEKGYDQLIDQNGRVVTFIEENLNSDDHSIGRVGVPVTDMDGLRLPSGFYRIYLTHESVADTLWRNIYIGKKGENEERLRNQFLNKNS